MTKNAPTKKTAVIKKDAVTKSRKVHKAAAKGNVKSVIVRDNGNLDIVGDNCRKMGDELYREWADYKDNKSAALALLAYKNVISVEKVKIAKNVLAHQLSNGGIVDGSATKFIGSDS